MRDMDYQPLVSILIPLYNQERYFEKCIRSVCNQTYKNLEIIVVNDGSTDKSLSIAQKWESQDNRIVVIDKKNEGPSKARFDAYRAATGEFVTPVDSDDYLPKNAIEILAGHMISKNVDAVMGSMTQVLGFIKRSHYTDSGSFPFHQVVKQPELFDKYYLNFFGKHFFTIMMCGCLYRKSVVDKAMRHTKLCCKEIPFVGEDHYCSMKIFPFLDSMYRTDETVYYYRCGGASSDRFSPTYPALFYLSDERLKLLDHYGLDEGYEPLFGEYTTVVLYHAQQLLEFKQTDKDGVVAFLKDELGKRAIASRMVEYYKQHDIVDPRLQMMVNRDYEAMYRFAVASFTNVTFKHRVKKVMLNLMDKFA